MDREIDRVLFDIMNRLEKLNDIGISLSSERDTDRLLENILMGAKELTNADAGTVYTRTEDDSLKFQIIRNDSLDIAMGGTTGKEISFPDLPLYKDGKGNLEMVAAHVALKDKTINIPDAYEAKGFDFTGTKAFDQKTGYRSQSFLAIPMKNHESEIIGVLQLINATDPDSGKIVPFSAEDQQLAQSLASQAAIAMTNHKLIEDLKILFESFIRAIANAIDDKSEYTGGHCERVPILAEMLAKAASKSDMGDLADFNPTEEELYELRIAAWMHDCGKVVTPDYVVDKSTKLETIYDRINTVNTRFEVLKRDVEINHLKKRLQALENQQEVDLANLEGEKEEALKKLDDDKAFIAKCNVGGEFMSPELQTRVKEIAKYEWNNTEGEVEPFLSEDEVANLNIAKGTLSKEERDIINHHVVASKNMLNALPFPKKLAKVPEIAGSHHEAMNGTGYPAGLKREELSIQARIMVIADVFEALTARDRPYKPAKSLAETLKILGFMKKDQIIDHELFKVLIDEKVYLEYGNKFLSEKQMDEVKIENIPGYE